MPFMFIGLNHTSSKYCIREKGVPHVSMIEFCFWSHHDVSSIIDLISVKWAPEHPHVRIWKNHFMINTTLFVRWGQFDTYSYIYNYIHRFKRIQFMIVKCLYSTNYIIFDSKIIFILYGDIWGLICKHHVQLIVMLHIP